MKILCICYMGMNRSKYAAGYLAKMGLDTEFAGIVPETQNLLTQERINQSDLIIFLLPEIQRKCLQHFYIGDQDIIVLDVEDRLDIICPHNQTPTPEELAEINETLVYKKIREQLEPHLPLILS